VCASCVTLQHLFTSSRAPCLTFTSRSLSPFRLLLVCSLRAVSTQAPLAAVLQDPIPPFSLSLSLSLFHGRTLAQTLARTVARTHACSLARSPALCARDLPVVVSTKAQQATAVTAASSEKNQLQKKITASYPRRPHEKSRMHVSRRRHVRTAVSASYCTAVGWCTTMPCAR